MIRIEERITQKVPGETSLFVTFDFQRIIVDELKLLPNCFYHDKTKQWEVPITCLAELLDRLNLHDEITLHLLPYETPAHHIYDLDDYKITPFPHQVEAIQWAINQRKGLLLDMPGLGKTGSMVWTAQELRKIYGIEHCLVICGINTLKMNWLMEINKLCDLDATILGSRINKKGNLVVDGVAKRVEHLNHPIDEFFVITNIETLRSDDIIKAINKGPNKFEMIVLDEAHVCLSPESIVETDKGVFPIKYVVNNKLDCKVKSFDVNTNSVVYKSIIGYHETKTRKPIIHLEVEEDSQVRTLDCTIDHQVYTKNRGFVPAMFLTEEDDIIIDF